MAETVYEAHISGGEIGYFERMNAAWRWSNGHAPDKAVLMALMNFAGRDESAYPSVKTLCAYTDLAERTVQESVKRLGQINMVERVARAGRSNIYVINFKKIDQVAVQLRLAPAPAGDAPPQEMHPTPAGDAPHPRSSCTHNIKLTTNNNSKIISQDQSEDIADVMTGPGRTESKPQVTALDVLNTNGGRLKKWGRDWKPDEIQTIEALIEIHGAENIQRAIIGWHKARGSKGSVSEFEEALAEKMGSKEYQEPELPRL